MLFKPSSRRRRFSKAVPGGEQAPTQGRPPRRSARWSALVDRVQLSGDVVAMYERVLCEIVNW